MDIKLLLTMVISLVVVLPVVAYIVNSIDKKDKTKDNISASMYMRNSQSNLIYSLYLIFKNFPLTRGYINKISRRYEIICPIDARKIADKTMTTVLITFMLCCAEIYLFFLMKPNLHNAVLVIYLVFVINIEVMNYYIGRAEIKLLENIEQFISDVGHNYFINRLVDDAILLSLEGQSREMKIHANRLYEVITSTNLKDDVIHYNATMHNKYLKMFLSLCASVIEYNDKKINGQMLFTANLMHLKKEINIEILKLRKLSHVFAGSVFVTIAVCAPIDAIQKFGISVVPELETFYKNQGGLIFLGLIYLSSIIVYTLINNAKEINQPVPKNNLYLKRLEKINIIKKALDNYTEKNYGRMEVLNDTLKRLGETISPRQLLLKRIITALLLFTLSIGLIFYTHYGSRNLLTHKVTSIESISSATNIKQQVLMSETILRYVNLYKQKTVTEEQLLTELIDEGTLNNTKLNEALAKEIAIRIKQYQAEYFKWYELLVCIGILIAGYFIPYLMILYRKKVITMIMEDEVNQYQSIIFMMMYIDHVTVIDILEQMELFAVVFKRSIQECMNDYNSGDIEALTRMKEKEPFGPFRRLVDNLIRCDIIAIENAFDEIASDRENYHDRRKLENEISIQKRADTIKPLSFIPAVIVTIYLLLPMLIAGLNMLAEFKESITSMGF